MFSHRRLLALLLVLELSIPFSFINIAGAGMEESRFDVNRDGKKGTVLRSTCEGDWGLMISNSIETDEGNYIVEWRALEQSYGVGIGAPYSYSYTAGPSAERVDAGVRIWENGVIKIDEREGAPAYKPGYVLLRAFLRSPVFEMLEAVLNISLSSQLCVKLSSTLSLESPYRVVYRLESKLPLDATFFVDSIRTPEFSEGWKGYLKALGKTELELTPKPPFGEPVLIVGTMIVNVAGREFRMPVVTHGSVGRTPGLPLQMPSLVDIKPAEISLYDPRFTVVGSNFDPNVKVFLISPQFRVREIQAQITEYSPDKLDVKFPTENIPGPGPFTLLALNPDGVGILAEQLRISEGVTPPVTTPVVTTPVPPPSPLEQYGAYIAAAIVVIVIVAAVYLIRARKKTA